MRVWSLSINTVTRATLTQKLLTSLTSNMNLASILLILSAGAVLGQESDIEFLNCPIIPRIPNFDFEDLNALAVAAIINSTEDMEAFLASGCDVNYNGTFRTDIRSDCQHSLFQQLSVSCRRSIRYTGFTPLQLAVLYSSLEVVKVLLEVPGIDLDAGSSWPSNPVWSAARAGDLDKLEALVSAGASLDFRGGNDGRVPVITAAVLSESVPTVAYLVNTGLDLDEKDYREFTASSYAAFGGQLEILKLLRSGGADFNVRVFADNQTLLMQASRNNQTEVVDYLIREGVDVNAVDSDLYSTLFYAAGAGNVAIVESLLAAGADIDFLNTEDQRPALYQAIANNRTDIALVLLQRGARVDIETAPARGGFTAAYFAAEVDKFGFLNTVRFTLFLGGKYCSIGGAHQEGV